MRKKLIPEDKILNLSKNVIQSFYGRDIENNIKYLADDFLWIGAFDFQYTTSKDEFLLVTQSEINSVPLKMMNEEFTLLSKSHSCYIVCAKFNLVGESDGNTIITTNTRLTIIWKYICDDLKLVHIHGSNAHDVPLTPSENNHEPTNDEFISFITSINNESYSNKLAFRDVTGTYHYFAENEVIYLKSNSQSTILHTTKGDIRIPGVLSKNANNMGDSFYRIHKKYVINSNYVKFLKRYIVTLSNDEQLPISKERFIAFREFTQNTKE